MDGFLDEACSTPTNQVLLNKLNITDNKQLQTAESDISGFALAKIVYNVKPVPGNFDAAHLKAIHKELFQDIYPWAGQTRAWGQFQGTKTIPGGTMSFAPYSQLDTRLDIIGDQLKQENYLRGLDKDQFVGRLAYYADQYNYTHAFREGNGRTLQAVMAEIGRGAGYDVRLSKQQADLDYNLARNVPILRLDIVKPGAPDLNLERLQELLAKATVPAPGEQAAQLRHPDQARPLLEPTAGMKHIEALRTLTTSGRELGSEIALVELGKHDFRPNYNEAAREKGQAVLDTTVAILHQPGDWPNQREKLLYHVQQVEKDPNVMRESLEHMSVFRTAASELDKNESLVMPFQLRELPGDYFRSLGKPVDELWRQGQVEKLLKGERSDHLPFAMPKPEGGIQHVPMQFKLQRDPAGAVAVQVYLPKDVMQALQQSIKTPAPGPAQKTPEQKPAAPTTQQNQREKEAKKPDAPKQKGPAPKRRGPKL